MRWQPRRGNTALTVVCKATYRLAPHLSPLAEEQEAPTPEDRHWDGNPARSLVAPSDLIPFKLRPEVLVVGHAFAPGGRPVHSLLAWLQVGEVRKGVEVWGDRAFSPEGQLSETAQFTAMSLCWEKAAGGPGTSNPPGMPFEAPDWRGVVPVPNLQPRGSHVAWPEDRFPPIGFGPLAPDCPTRAERSPRGWAIARWSEAPLPEGLDAGCFNAALPDQHLEALQPDQEILLDNLHREHARLATRLAKVIPRAVAERADGAHEELPLVADTLWIDTDRGVCTLVWRGNIWLRHAQEAGQVVVRAEGAGVEAWVATHREARRGKIQPNADEEDTLWRTPPRAGVTILLGAEQDTRAHAGGEHVARTASAPLEGPSSTPVLPFRAATQLPASDQAVASVPSVASATEERPRWALSAASPGQTVSAPLLVPGTRVLPFQSPLERPPDPDRSVLAAATSSAATVPLRALPVPLSPAAPEMPPALLFPAPSPAPPPATQAAPAFPTLPAAAPPPDPEHVSLERCATVAASLARRRPERSSILEEHGLTPAAWAAVEAHWAAAIKRETTCGKTALLKRFDEAYVAQLEKERGPLLVTDYARLVIGSERGNVGEILAELTLPREALMRIERLWLDRTLEDVELSRQVRRAVNEAREV
ncbi:DUF2169 family type VI secretion system accessory protein [Chondromyces apiculatus]|uniref:DUF2169 family type VI secretion system accessory protein n=1 Tax=Chondromyces apiculatus TaxID=51 RepID=UPI0018CC6A5E|nr:DUF2169 domain-containing protein [Chondromyces apiculatus]